MEDELLKSMLDDILIDSISDNLLHKLIKLCANANGKESLHNIYKQYNTIGN